MVLIAYQHIKKSLSTMSELKLIKLLSLLPVLALELIS